MLYYFVFQLLYILNIYLSSIWTMPFLFLPSYYTNTFQDQLHHHPQDPDHLEVFPPPTNQQFHLSVFQNLSKNVLYPICKIVTWIPSRLPFAKSIHC